MKSSHLLRLIRPAVLVGVLALVLAASLQGRAWANVVRDPLAQSTVRVVTPDGKPVVIIAPALPPGSSSSTATPWSSTVVSVPGIGTVNIAAGVLKEPGTIVITKVDVSTLGPPKGGHLVQAIEINFYDKDGNLVEHTQFLQPAQICIDSPGKSDRNRSIQFLDTTQTPAQWVMLPQATESGGAVCSTTSHLTLFALVEGGAAGPADAGVPVSELPRTSGGNQPLLPGWAWLLVSALLLGGAGLTLRTRMSRSR